jgi:hypothetical protein
MQPAIWPRLSAALKALAWVVGMRSTPLISVRYSGIKPFGQRRDFGVAALFIAVSGYRSLLLVQDRTNRHLVCYRPDCAISRIHSAKVSYSDCSLVSAPRGA